MYAAKLVAPNDFIYIDAGTTTEYLIDYLDEKMQHMSLML